MDSLINKKLEVEISETVEVREVDNPVQSVQDVREVDNPVQSVQDVQEVGGGGGLIKQSTAGGTQKLVISNNVIQGSDQGCLSCLIHCPDGNSGDIYLTTKNETADANDFLVPKGQIIPIPVDNLSDLHFYGSSNDDIIYVLWRN